MAIDVLDDEVSSSDDSEFDVTVLSTNSLQKVKKLVSWGSSVDIGSSDVYTSVLGKSSCEIDAM